MCSCNMYPEVPVFLLSLLVLHPDPSPSPPPPSDLSPPHPSSLSARALSPGGVLLGIVKHRITWMHQWTARFIWHVLGVITLAYAGPPKPKRSIEMLLRSRRIRHRIEAGTLELHAGVMDASTGRVRYFGEHPMQASMIETAKTIDRLERDEHGVIPRSRWQSAFKDDFREGVSAEERPLPHALGSGSPESISVGQ